MRRRRCPAHALGAPDSREPLRGSLSVRLRLRLYDRTVPIARPQRLRREGLHGHLFPCLHRGVPVLRDSGRVLGLGQRASRRLCAHVRPLHRGYGNMPVSGLLRPRAERAARGGLRIGAWGSFKRGAPYRTGVC